MKVYRNLSEFSPHQKAIVTAGTFDGVHIGHQKLLTAITKVAHDENGESVLLTFSPHPRLVLFPDDNDLKLLSTLEEKVALLEKSGLDHLIIHPFTKAFSRISARDYIQKILVEALGVTRLVIGYDHHFGRNREGNLEVLKNAAPEYGFAVQEIPAREIDDVDISSTKIRTALIEGDVTTANEYLGYTYALTGKVVEGNKIGRSIGYPTANITPNDTYKLVPGIGVYAVFAKVDGQIRRGMASIGTRPTVTDSNEVVIEVHLFETDADMYGKEVRLFFVKRLRDEIKFESIEILVNQMKNDAIDTELVLAAGTIDYLG